MDKKTTDALASMIYVSRIIAEGGSITDDDQKIRASGVFVDWTPGVHTVGQIFNAPDADGNDQTWECYADYDNATHPDIVPGNIAWPTFNRPLHGKTPVTARPWVTPTHSMDIYRFNEHMIWTDGLIYRCKAENGTNFSPAEYADYWECVSEVPQN